MKKFKKFNSIGKEELNIATKIIKNGNFILFNEYINNLLRQRNPLYAKAHIHVESKNETKLIMKNKLLLSINNYLEYENYE